MKVGIILSGHASQNSVFLATAVKIISTLYVYKMNKGLWLQKFSGVNKPWPPQDSLGDIVFSTDCMCFK